LPNCLLRLSDLVSRIEPIGRKILSEKSVASANIPHQQASLQRHIAATDRQIDELVYELYGLTDDEIRIVEQPTHK